MHLPEIRRKRNVVLNSKVIFHCIRVHKNTRTAITVVVLEKIKNLHFFRSQWVKLIAVFYSWFERLIVIIRQHFPHANAGIWRNHLRRRMEIFCNIPHCLQFFKDSFCEKPIILGNPLTIDARMIVNHFQHFFSSQNDSISTILCRQIHIQALHKHASPCCVKLKNNDLDC